MNATKRPAPKTEAAQRAEFMQQDLLRAMAKLTGQIETIEAKTWTDLTQLTELKKQIDELIDFNSSL